VKLIKAAVVDLYLNDYQFKRQTVVINTKKLLY